MVMVPVWLNTSDPRVRIITHNEIFEYKEHLPTFSSRNWSQFETQKETLNLLSKIKSGETGGLDYSKVLLKLISIEYQT